MSRTDKPPAARGKPWSGRFKEPVTDLVRGMQDFRWAFAPAVAVAICALGLVAFLAIGHEISEFLVIGNGLRVLLTRSNRLLSMGFL